MGRRDACCSLRHLVYLLPPAAAELTFPSLFFNRHLQAPLTDRSPLNRTQRSLDGCANSKPDPLFTLPLFPLELPPLIRLALPPLAHPSHISLSLSPLPYPIQNLRLGRAPPPEESFDALAHRLYSVVDMAQQHATYLDGLQQIVVPSYSPVVTAFYRTTLDSLAPETVTVPVLLDCLLLQVEANVLEAAERDAEADLRPNSRGRSKSARGGGTATSQTSLGDTLSKRKDKERASSPLPESASNRKAQTRADVTSYVEGMLEERGLGEEHLAEAEAIAAIGAGGAGSAMDKTQQEGNDENARPTSGQQQQSQQQSQDASRPGSSCPAILSEPTAPEALRQAVVRYGDAVAAHLVFLSQSAVQGDYDALAGARRVLAASRAARLVDLFPSTPPLSSIERAAHDQQLLSFCNMPLPDVKRTLELLEFERMAASVTGKRRTGGCCESTWEKAECEKKAGAYRQEHIGRLLLRLIRAREKPMLKA